MLNKAIKRPLFVGPSPEVLAAIRGEMESEGYSPQDRRMPTVEAALAVEPINVQGLNEGIFYPENQVPRMAAGLGPSEAVRARPTTGTLRCLVLLVDFPDNRGSRSPGEFRDMLFSQGTYPTGSMRDFYKENSYDQLDLEGEVVGWLTLSEPYSYYVAGESGTSRYPHNAQKMVEEALGLAAQEVDFGQLDGDDDGYLDGLFVVHAGGGAEADRDTQARKKKIWSHQWQITQPFVSDGVTAYSYCTEPEDGRVGVFCHEFGHMLGLPDLYDTTYESEGVGIWCVMGAGSWLDGGTTPGHFCLWSKARLGWIDPTVVTEGQSLQLNPIEEDRRAGYRLWTRGEQRSEYFLIENRQPAGFDSELPSGGLLIYHINDSEHNNDHPGRYWVGVMQADGRNDLEFGRNRGDVGDPYPGSANNTHLDETSNPSSIDTLGRPTTVSVSEITVSDGVVRCEASV